MQYYGPDYELDVRSSNMENANSKEYLEKIKIQVIENLKKTAHAPSVQLTDVPRTTLMGDISDYEEELDDLDEDLNADERVTMRMLDQRIARDDELDDSDNEDDAVAMNGVRPQPGAHKRRNIMDYQNPNSVADDIEVDNQTAATEQENGIGENATAPSIEAKEEPKDTLMEENEESTAGAEAVEDEPSTAPSGSPNPALDGEGDVEMEQPAPPEPPVQVPTPTSQVHSPPPAAADVPTPAPTTAEETPLSQDPAEAKQEGEEERQDADVAGEESTEIAQQSQT